MAIQPFATLINSIETHPCFTIFSIHQPKFPLDKVAGAGTWFKLGCSTETYLGMTSAKFTLKIRRCSNGEYSLNIAFPVKDEKQVRVKVYFDSSDWVVDHVRVYDPNDEDSELERKYKKRFAGMSALTALAVIEYFFRANRGADIAFDDFYHSGFLRKMKEPEYCNFKALFEIADVPIPSSCYEYWHANQPKYLACLYSLKFAKRADAKIGFSSYQPDYFKFLGLPARNESDYPQEDHTTEWGDETSDDLFEEEEAVVEDDEEVVENEVEEEEHLESEDESGIEQYLEYVVDAKVVRKKRIQRILTQISQGILEGAEEGTWYEISFDYSTDETKKVIVDYEKDETRKTVTAVLEAKGYIVTNEGDILRVEWY